MKDALSSLDLRYLVRELQQLVGSRLDKAYQGADDAKRDLCLQFHKTGEGKLLLRILLPGLAYIASEKPVYPKMPGYFAVFLRRHVGNARLIGVRQRGFDRILELSLENKDGAFTLVLELLPPGNLLLLNSDGKIISLLVPKRHGSRTLRGGAIYEPPPVQFDTTSASADEITERLFASKGEIVRSVATRLGLGGEYAEEACARAGVDKARKDCSKEELATVAAAVKGLFDEKDAPFAADEDAHPFAMRTKEATAQFPSFSEAIASLVVEDADTALVEEAERTVSKRKDVRAHQEAALAGYLKSAEENHRKGELLYERYQDVQKLLERVHELRKEGGWTAVKEGLPDLEIDQKKGELVVEL